MPGGDEAAQRQHRDQQRGDAQTRAQPPIAVAETQPDMQADASMRPGQHQRDRLQHAEMGLQHPDAHQHRAVTGAHAELGHAAGAQHMQQQQRRQGEARQQPEDFQRPQAARRADRRQRIEGIGDMHGQRGIEQELRGRQPPEPQEPAAAPDQRLVGDEAQSVVEQMAQDIDEQHQTRNEPRPGPEPLPVHPGHRHVGPIVAPAKAGAQGKECRKRRGAFPGPRVKPGATSGVVVCNKAPDVRCRPWRPGPSTRFRGARRHGR